MQCDFVKLNLNMRYFLHYQTCLQIQYNQLGSLYSFLNSLISLCKKSLISRYISSKSPHKNKCLKQKTFQREHLFFFFLICNEQLVLFFSFTLKYGFFSGLWSIVESKLASQYIERLVLLKTSVSSVRSHGLTYLLSNNIIWIGHNKNNENKI